MFIQPGSVTVTVELVQGMIIAVRQRDACVALAEAVAGSTDALCI